MRDKFEGLDLLLCLPHKCIVWEKARAQEAHEALHVVSVGLVITAVGRKALDRVTKKVVCWWT